MTSSSGSIRNMSSSGKLYSDCFKSPCQRSAGIYSAEIFLLNTVVGRKNLSDDRNDDWCVVSRIKREKNCKGKILAIVSQIPCRNQPECKWRSSCWYMHDNKKNKQIEMKHHAINVRGNRKEEKENDLAVKSFKPVKKQENNSSVTNTKPQIGCLGIRFKYNFVKK